MRDDWGGRFERGRRKLLPGFERLCQGFVSLNVSFGA